MGRRPLGRALSIWSNGARVGTWRIPSRGEMELRYDRAWMESPLARPLSLSLPFGVDESPLKGDVVRHFFENLLPDSDVIRRRIAARFGTGSTDPFDLLAAIGRDCVGSVQLLRDDETPEGLDRIEGTRLDDAGIETHLLGMIDDAPSGAEVEDDDFRIALAGAQEKDALLRWKGRWLRPHRSTPTTHIFKMPLGFVGGHRADFRTSVDNEWLCLRILRGYGFETADAEIRTFGAQRVLVVTRFDRQPHASGRSLLRLPQEDFCQALGVSPLLKYESQGGPGIVDLCRIALQSERAERDLDTLLAAQIVFWLLRAPDGHAKNFSIRLLAGGRFHLTPLYDVMSAYPVLGDGPNRWSEQRLRMSMAMLGKGKHYAFRSIQRRHFNATARRCGFGRDAESIIERILERTPSVIAEASADLPKGFTTPVAEAILRGLQDAARALESMPAA